MEAPVEARGAVPGRANSIRTRGWALSELSGRWLGVISTGCCAFKHAVLGIAWGCSVWGLQLGCGQCGLLCI